MASARKWLSLWAGLTLTLLSACQEDGDDPDRSCLARPDRLSSAPATRLPCELLPPGLNLKK